MRYCLIAILPKSHSNCIMSVHVNALIDRCKDAFSVEQPKSCCPIYWGASVMRQQPTLCSRSVMIYCLWLSQRKNSGQCINTSTVCLPPFHSVSFNTSSPYHCSAEGHPITSFTCLSKWTELAGCGKATGLCPQTTTYIYSGLSKRRKQATSGLALGEMLPGLQIGSWQATILLNEEIWRQENGDAVVAGSFTEDQAGTAPSAQRPPPLAPSHPSGWWIV